MSLQRLRRRLNAPSGDAGITLVELVVVGAISSILLLAVGVTFAGSLKASQAATTRVSATAESRVAMEVVASRLRVAVRPVDQTPTNGHVEFPSIIREAHADRLVFFASLTSGASTADPAPSLVTYRIDSVQGCLREDITPRSGTAPTYTWTTGTTTRCIAHGIVAPALFSYYTGVPQPTEADPTPTVTEPTLLAAPGTCSDYDTTPVPECDVIYSVQVDMSLRTAGPGSKPVATSTRILLVNRHSEDLA